MSGQQDAEFLHKIAKGLAEVEGISEDKAIQMIRERTTFNSELHTKIPAMQQPQYIQPPRSSILDSTADLFAKGSAQYNASQAGSQSSALEMRKLELEEERLKIEQRRYDAEQKRIAQEQEERKDRIAFKEKELAIKEEKDKREHQLEREALKIERETSRAEQRFTQLLALGQNSGKGSDEILKMIENQNTSQREYFKEINTVKDNERKHTDTLRTDLSKIESDRDVELAKLKANSDNSTADAIDAMVIKMDENFNGMMKDTGGDDGEDFLDKYNTQIEKVNTFQKNLTAAGLNTLKSQGVDVDALKKAHNIATESEESTLDKIIGVGKDLYEKTIKPGMEEAAKNGSGSVTNSPSGLETAFETPDIDMEAKIRAEQDAQDQITIEEQNRIEQENALLIKQYETTLYNKALQYNIPTHGLSLEELESMIKQYETIMSTPFHSAPQTKSIIGMGKMALELKINTTGKTVEQVESEVIQAQLKIEQQLDKLPDYIPDQYQDQPSEPVEHTPIPVLKPEQYQEVINTEIEVMDPGDGTHAIPDNKDNGDNDSPKEFTQSTPTEEPEVETPKEPIPVQDTDLDPKPIKSPGQKRSVTAKRNSNEKKPLKKFTTSDGTVVEGKSPYSVAVQLAKQLGGTSESPTQVELTGEDGKISVFETRMDETKLRGGITSVPRAKRVKHT